MLKLHFIIAMHKVFTHKLFFNPCTAILAFNKYRRDKVISNASLQTDKIILEVIYVCFSKLLQKQTRDDKKSI